MEDTREHPPEHEPHDPGHDGAAPAVSIDDLIDRVPAIVYVDVADPQAQVGHRTVYLSRGVTTLLGYEPAEILADPDQWLRIVHPDDIEALLERTRRHLAEPSVLSSEYRLIHRDGRVLTVRDDCTSAIDPATGRMASRGVITDITALRESEDSFQAFLERLPIVAYSESPDETKAFIYIGPEIETLTGYPPAAYFADDRLFERQVHPADRDRQLEGYGVPGRRYEAEYRLLHRDGRSVWVRDRAVTEVDHNGAVTAIHGFLIDISEAQDAREALAAAEERYRTLVERLPLVIYVDRIDDGETGSYRSAYISPQVERLLGYPPEAFRDDPTLWRSLVHPDDVERAYTARHQPGGTGDDILEYRMTRADGEMIWVREGARIVFDEQLDASTIQGYIVDITEAKRAEEALVRAQKLESLGNLAGGIAHDFNNLLVSILGNAELALLDLAPDQAEVRDSIVQVEVAARRAADLSRQMLAYSGRGQFSVEPLSVNELVAEIVDLLRVAIGKGVGLSLRLGDDLPPIEADATQLRQVVMNIVVNASDAIGPDGGQIAIATERAALTRADITDLYWTTEMAPGDYVMIEISDTGVGMDADTVQRIFDPFFTTKFAGRGLGLAAVLGIVSGHRGGIAVESERGRGSRFRIYLPPTTRPVRNPVTPAPEVAQREGRILIADDDASVRSVGRRMLERIGWFVEEASNGAEAVERVVAMERAEEPALDAVLLDLTMPVLDGEGALLRIRELRPGLPVVLMSGFTETDVVERFGDGGPARFVQKPFTPVELTTALDEAIAEVAKR